MKRIVSLSLMLFLLLAAGCSSVKEPLYPAGARSSRYGIRPFPDPREWGELVGLIERETSSEAPALIWIVGVIVRDRGKSLCRLNFPSDGEPHELISFHGVDENEAYLDYFDKAGIRVYLQVEPGDADVEELIDLVLSRYGHHRSVVGFGVDAEWYRINGTEGWGTPIGDHSASGWEERVQSYKRDYRLFLKHWDSDWMPPRYRGDLIFVNDSQGFDSLATMKNEFLAWADTFYPNPVFFQTGYDSDRDLWSALESPVRDLHRILSEDVRQPNGFFWVDFTLRDLAR